MIDFRVSEALRDFKWTDDVPDRVLDALLAMWTPILEAAVANAPRTPGEILADGSDSEGATSVLIMLMAREVKRRRAADGVRR